MVFKLDLSEPWELLDTIQGAGYAKCVHAAGVGGGGGGLVHESSNEAQKQAWIKAKL